MESGGLPDKMFSTDVGSDYYMVVAKLTRSEAKEGKD
jgi:hypothetical protein